MSAGSAQAILIATDRQIVCRLVLPAGTVLTGVRLPISDLTTDASLIEFTVHDDIVLGTTGDVSTLLSTGSAQVWRNIPLAGGPAALVGEVFHVGVTTPSTPAARCRSWSTPSTA